MSAQPDANQGLTVLEELARLDKIVRDCEASLSSAERLKAQGRWQVRWDDELNAVAATLAKTLRERNWLDGAISRAASERPMTREEGLACLRRAGRL